MPEIGSLPAMTREQYERYLEFYNNYRTRYVVFDKTGYTDLPIDPSLILPPFHLAPMSETPRQVVTVLSVPTSNVQYELRFQFWLLRERGAKPRTYWGAPSEIRAPKALMVDGVEGYEALAVFMTTGGPGVDTPGWTVFAVDEAGVPLNMDFIQGVMGGGPQTDLTRGFISTHGASAEVTARQHLIPGFGFTYSFLHWFAFPGSSAVATRLTLTADSSSYALAVYAPDGFNGGPLRNDPNVIESIYGPLKLLPDVLARLGNVERKLNGLQSDVERLAGARPRVLGPDGVIRRDH